MEYRQTVGSRTYLFDNLTTLLAKASPLRSGDVLAGLAAGSEEERIMAKIALADVPLPAFLTEEFTPYHSDEVTRLILDSHDKEAFRPIRHLTVGGFRDWLLGDEASRDVLSSITFGLTPEMVAAVSKLMRNQDLILCAAKCQVVTQFRNTIGLPGRLSVRLQPNHPTDDSRGIAASIIDGLLYGCGDAVIGINPATDQVETVVRLLEMLEEFHLRLHVPAQSCVLSHVTNTIA